MKNGWMVWTLTCGLALLGNANLQAAEENTAETLKEGNVWTTPDGTKYFTCPVMKGEGVVGNEDGISMVDGVKYYHCCPPCQGPFRKDPQKWLSELFLPANIIEVDANGTKHFKDPVNGEHGHVEKETPVIDQDGKRWYFTSKKSQKTFRKAPEKYAGTAS